MTPNADARFKVGNKPDVASANPCSAVLGRANRNASLASDTSDIHEFYRQVPKPNWCVFSKSQRRNYPRDIIVIIITLFQYPRVQEASPMATSTG